MRLAVWTKHFVLLFLTVVHFFDIFPKVATLDATCWLKNTSYIAFSYGRKFVWYFPRSWNSWCNLLYEQNLLYCFFLWPWIFLIFFTQLQKLMQLVDWKIPVTSLLLTVVNLSDIFLAAGTVDDTCSMNKTCCIAFSYGREFFWYFSYSCNSWWNLLTKKYQLHRFFLRS